VQIRTGQADICHRYARCRDGRYSQRFHVANATAHEVLRKIGMSVNLVTIRFSIDRGMILRLGAVSYRSVTPTERR